MKKRKIRNKENKTKSRFQRILLIIIIIVVLILFIIGLNIILRKEIQLKENHIKALEKIFPDKHIKDIRLYERGLFSIGSTRVICKSIYFENNGLGKYFFENPDSNESMVLLVHEATHTYQSRKSFGCIKMMISSLYNQFFAYLKYGSRNYAYYYSLDSEENFNPEQEASIIEDYFNLKFVNKDIKDISCKDCENLNREELIKQLGILTKDILSKYD